MSRAGHVLSAIQLTVASYLLYVVADSVSERGDTSCYTQVATALGAPPQQPGTWRSNLKAVAITVCVVTWLLALAQVIVGTEVLAWRAVYRSKDALWRAHYREIFDRGIRELLCCLGRPQYWNANEDDDVDTVSTLLGDLAAYRAVGASHLEVLAGLAMLRSSKENEMGVEGPHPPPELVREAAALHLYAVAAYTGFLLDIGRNPVTWTCVWSWRQGMLMPCYYSKRPKLEGDNSCRGHAAAFLQYAKLKPECLRKGRVKQLGPAQAVYFVVSLHHLKTVVVAVRGTESPEDLLIDGLGREVALSSADLSGMLSSSNKKQEKDEVPHFGHSGVVAAARELAQQLDNMPADEGGEEGEGEEGRGPKDVPRGAPRGLLSEMLGPGGECEGYALRIVGHSMGGAVASLTGLRGEEFLKQKSIVKVVNPDSLGNPSPLPERGYAQLLRRFPSLHCYGYGSMPCVDEKTAQACSSFVTTVVYHDEFAPRLSVASVMRLRARALRAVAGDSGSQPILQTISQQVLKAIPQQASEQASAAVTAVGQAFTNTVHSVGEAMGLRSDKHESQGFFNIKPPRQWAALGFGAEVGGYAKEDYSSLAQYSMATGGRQFAEWREGRMTSNIDNRKKRRHRRIKHQVQGARCLGNHLLTCVSQASCYGRSKPKVDSEVIAKCDFHTCDGCGHFLDECQCEKGAPRGKGAVGGGRRMMDDNNYSQGGGGADGVEHRMKMDFGQGPYQRAKSGVGNLLRYGEGIIVEAEEEAQDSNLLPSSEGKSGDKGKAPQEMQMQRNSSHRSSSLRQNGEHGAEIGENSGEDEGARGEMERGDQKSKPDRADFKEKQGKGGPGDVHIGKQDSGNGDTHLSQQTGSMEDRRDLDPKETSDLDADDEVLDTNSERVKFPVEVHVPGQVMHIIRNQGTAWEMLTLCCGAWSFFGTVRPRHRAVMGSREMLKEITVSPSMFLDHVPWRCSHALNEVLRNLHNELQDRRLQRTQTGLDYVVDIGEDKSVDKK